MKIPRENLHTVNFLSPCLITYMLNSSKEVELDLLSNAQITWRTVVSIWLNIVVGWTCLTSFPQWTSWPGEMRGKAGLVTHLGKALTAVGWESIFWCTHLRHTPGPRCVDNDELIHSLTACWVTLEAHWKCWDAAGKYSTVRKYSSLFSGRQ